MARYVHKKFRQIPLEMRRAAIDDILAGRKRQIDVADALGLRRQTVNAWVTRARKGLPPANRGRPPTPILNAEQHTALLRELRDSAPADPGDGMAGGWDWRGVIAHVAQRYALRIYRSYAIRLLQEAKDRPAPSSRRIPPPPTRGPLKTAELTALQRRIAATQQKLRERGVCIGADGRPIPSASSDKPASG